MDGKYVSFEVTATDQYDGKLTKSTTPAILIDNVPPSIQNFNITGNTGTDGSIIHKDEITFNAYVVGANATSNAVTVDLTNMDGTGLKNLTKLSENNWTYKHTVNKYTLDGVFPFVLVTKDLYGNKSELQFDMLVDNDPPEFIASYSTETKRNSPYIIIGDSITAKVLDSISDDVKATLDLTDIDKYYVEMSNNGIDEFNYSFEIGTGTLNNGAIFPVTIKDNAGNKAVIYGTSNIANVNFSYPLLDQKPPSPLEPTITMVNHSSLPDEYPNVMNSKKTITFSLPYIRETNREDHATATLDVTYLPKVDGLNYITGNLQKSAVKTNLVAMDEDAGGYTLTIVATNSPDLEEKLNVLNRLIDKAFQKDSK